MTRDQRIRKVVRASKSTRKRKPQVASSAPLSIGPETYIRFVTSDQDDQSGSSRGVFHAAYGLQRSTFLEPHEYDWLGDTIVWYEKNLPVPTYLKKTRKNELAICWFRVNAQQKIQRLWDLVHLLEEFCVFIRTIKTKTPGRIVFQDEFQIVAVPEYRTPR